MVDTGEVQPRIPRLWFRGMLRRKMPAHGGILAALSRRNLRGAELEPSTGIKLLGEDSEARIRFQGLIRTMDDIAQITGRG